MFDSALMRWPDLVVIGLNFAAMVVIGIYCARKTSSADAYFLANRSMPGWVVAVSMMATIVSSMTFLATPGYTFHNDWRFMPAHALYFVPAIVTYFIFMPFFRRSNIRSAYEYLELRFGTWARLYGATTFLFYHMFRTGIILYSVSLPFQYMIGVDLASVIAILGILVAIYTVAGGIEAVIYTDFIQGLALMIGGLIVVPIVAYLLPGGFSQIISEAYADGKFSWGNTGLESSKRLAEVLYSEKTVWVIIINYQFMFLQMLCTDQNMVQRYLAMKSDKDARRGFILGTALIIPVWMYFAFIGTALYVYYKAFPATALNGVQPEEVFPYFILTQVPAGVAGFILAGLLAAAMSTLDSSINASAATLTNDFYRRFRPHAGNERHYLGVGRLFSILFAGIMILVALSIHWMRTQTLMELQTVLYPVVSAGLLSLFLLGFLTVRVGSRAALIATGSTVLLVAGWVFLTSETGERAFPSISNWIPNDFWLGVIPHLFLLVLGLLVSYAVGRDQDRCLTGLTIWTIEKE